MTKRHEKIARDCINAAIARIAPKHGVQIAYCADYAAQGEAYIRAQGIKTLLTMSNPKLEKSLKKINALSIGLSLMPNYRGTCPYELYRAIHEIGAAHNIKVYAYEYTKDWHDNKHEAVRAMHAGYLYRVYSAHEHISLRAIRDKIAQGKPVAVVFRDYTGKPDTLPATWHGMPVIDGVEHDMRPLDCALTGAPAGHIVALAPIGLANRHLESPFMWDLQDGARC